MYYLNSREMTDLEKFVSLCLKKYDLLSDKELEIIKIIYNKLERKAIMDLAVKEKIVPFVTYAMSKTNIEKSFWQKKYNYFRDRNTKIVKLLDTIFKEMNNKNIPIFLYENFGSLLLSEEDIGLFCSGDVDLCSSLEYKEEIIKVLSSFGYFLRIRKYENLNVWTEFCNAAGTNDIWINVMWVPITEKVLAVAPGIDSKFFFNDITPIKNLNINVPSRTNLLFLCLLHTSVHKYTCSPGMKLNVDIDRLVISGKISWEKIVALAIKYNVKRRIAISLMLVSDFLGTLVPQKTIIELGGNEYNTKKAYNYLVGHSFLANKSDEINRFRSFYLAALLHDKGLLIGFLRILFPERKWLSKIYSTPNENNILKEYLLRIKRIFN
jgi:hypothetical protein